MRGKNMKAADRLHKCSHAQHFTDTREKENQTNDNPAKREKIGQK
jgi:hypothetical protein